MVQPKPFSQYLADARAKYGVSADPNAAAAPLSTGAGVAKSGPSNPDILSNVLDWASGTVRMVENIPNQIMNEQLKQIKAQQTGTEYDTWGGIGNVLSSPVRGLFSYYTGDVNDKPYGAQLFEKYTDVQGQAANPDYVDTKNNADPTQKGFAGFGLDMALDPLTWIPGAQIAKVGTLAGKAVKPITEALSGAVAAANAGRKGAKAEDVIASAAKVSEDGGMADNATNLMDRVPQTAAPVVPVAETVAPTFSTNQINAALRTGRTSPEAAKASEFMATLRAPEPAVAAPKLPTAGEWFSTVAINAPPATALGKAARIWVDAKKAGRVAPNAEAIIRREYQAWKASQEAAFPAGAIQVSEFTDVPTMREFLASTKKADLTPDDFAKKYLTFMSKSETGRNIPIESTRQLGGDALTAQDVLAQLKSAEAAIRSAKPRTAAMKAARKQKQDIMSALSLNFEDYSRLSRMDAGVGSIANLQRFMAAAQEPALALDTAVGERLAKQFPDFTSSANLDARMNWMDKVLSGDIKGAELAKTSLDRFQKDFLTRLGLSKEMVASFGRSTPLGAEPVSASGSYVADSLIKKLPKVLKDKADNTAKPYVTDTGVNTSSDILGGGYANDGRYLNTEHQSLSQEAVMAPLFEAAKNERRGARQKVIASEQRSKFIMDEAYPELVMQERLYLDNGMPIWTTINNKLSGKRGLPVLRGDADGLTRVLVTNSQIWRVMRQADPEIWGLAVANGGTILPYTNYLEAVAFIVAKEGPVTVDEVSRFLANTTKSTRAGELTNTFAKGGKVSFTPKTKINKMKPKDTDLVRYESRIDKATGRVNGWWGVTKGDAAIERLSRALVDNADEFKAIQLKNADELNIRIGDEAHYLADEQVAQILKWANDPKELRAALYGVRQSTYDTIKAGTRTGATDSGIQTAVDGVNYLVPTEVQQAATAATKTEDALTSAGKVTDKNRKLPPADIDEAAKAKAAPQVQKGFDDAQDSVDEAVAGFEADPNYRGDVFTPEDKASLVYGTGHAEGFRRILDPLGKRFVGSWGKERTYGDWIATRELASKVMGEYHKKLNGIQKLFPGLANGQKKTNLATAFRSVQQGQKAIPELEEAANALQEAMTDVISLMDNAASDWAVGRAGLSVEDINFYMARADLPYEFDLSAAKLLAEEKNISLHQAAFSQWREWGSIEDPLEFLQKMQVATLQAVSDKTTANSFMKMARANGYVHSGPAAGFSRVENASDSVFFRHLPQDTYVKTDLLEEFNRLENFSQESRKINGDIGKIVNSYYLPVLNAWKKGVTILRPGHHIRNYISSLSTRYLAEGTRNFGKATVIGNQVVLSKKSYEGVDGLELLKNMDNAELPGTGTVMLDDGFGPLTNDDILQIAETNGLHPTFVNEAGLFDEAIAGSGVQRVSDFVTMKNNIVGQSAASLAEFQAHVSRTEHLVQILLNHKNSKGIYSPKFKTREELIAYAVKRVRKFHPDSSTLTPWERKYMMPLIPFYSWTRGILPAMVESALLQPGRVLMFPKASFNLAIAMGVDPYQMYDPFPEDQLFPSFLTDQVTGPIAKIGSTYFNASPGIASIDIANQLLSDPARSLPGMLTPAIKVPGELISGVSWGTGSKIKDMSDYIDANIPGVNYIANISGTSVTGSIASALAGRGIDPQYSVSKGNKTPLDQALTASNWITGLGISNVSKESFINLAELEKRNREAQKAKEAAGTARNAF